MLTCKELVVKTVTHKDYPLGYVTQEYLRVYLEFAPSDPVEDKSKTYKGKDVQHNGVKWVGQRPKEDVSTTDPRELFQAAIAFFSGPEGQAVLGAKADKPIDPVYGILQAASYGADLWVKNGLTAKLGPKEEISREEQILRQAKLMVANGFKNKAGVVLTLEQCVARATAMYDLE